MRIYKKTKFSVGVLFGLVLSIALISVSCDTEDITETVEPVVPAKPTEPDVSADPANQPVVYHADDIQIQQDIETLAQPDQIAYGTEVEGKLFDGYPQIIKQEGSQPIYSVKVEKDLKVPMRDGVNLCADVYRPDAEGKFPALVSWCLSGKDVQEMTRWLPPVPYYHSPFWDGFMEAGNIDYVVTRGYVHVIPDLRGTGYSEGKYEESNPNDIYDTIEWVAVQPWCNGKVAMMGECGFARSQVEVAQLDEPPPHLVAIAPTGLLGFTAPTGFSGIYSTVPLAIPETAKHGNDNLPPARWTERPAMLDHPNIDALIKEALNHPDIRYNPRYYSIIKYPFTAPHTFNGLMAHFHPRPAPSKLPNVKIPTFLGTNWNLEMYIWKTFQAWREIGTPEANKKLMLWPSYCLHRPFVDFDDEIVRWYDYWLKGIDNGIMEEPPIKMFVMGINKWRFENKWPLERTNWEKFYLHPEGGLSTDPVSGNPQPDSFTQPAPYKDPSVHALTYTTQPFEEDMEVTGEIAFYLHASIDIDDTNWFADLVDVDPEGNRRLVSTGSLGAEHRALDTKLSRPYRPVHLKQDPVPVPSGEVIEYAIGLTPTSNVFRAGHSMQLIIRNQDDLLSRLGLWGIKTLPFMRTVTHNIHFGKSHLLLPVISAN